MQTETRDPNVPRDSKGYKIAEAFYDAFKKLDAKTMGGLYAEDATFSDPGFPGLDARHVRGMWDMLCSTCQRVQPGL